MCATAPQQQPHDKKGEGETSPLFNMFYTYIHFRKDDSKPFYVGKGSGNRHLSKVGRNSHWKNIVNKHGFDSKIMASWECEQDAFEHERFLISCFKDIGIKLVNLTDGGEGASGAIRTSEQKKRYSQTTWKHTDRAKQEMMGELNPAKRLEVRKMLSENNAHRNPEIRAKGAATFRAFGDKHPSKSEKHRAFMRDNNPAKRPDVRAKMVAAALAREAAKRQSKLESKNDHH